MLTKMPKVGDVLIANENDCGYVGYLTKGNEYVVSEFDGRDAWVPDNRGIQRVIGNSRFKQFTLKHEVQPAEPVGFIEMSDTAGVDGNYYSFGVTVDSAGFKALKALAEQSKSQRKRSEIQTKIAALQAELDAL